MTEKIRGTPDMYSSILPSNYLIRRRRPPPRRRYTRPTGRWRPQATQANPLIKILLLLLVTPRLTELPCRGSMAFM